MQAASTLPTPARMVRRAALACVAAALVFVVAFSIAGMPVVGGAIATGLLLGSLNGAAAARLIRLPVPFMATSLLRIMTLSMVAVGIGLAFGISRVWLVVLGLGLAQFCLAAAALREAARR